MRKIIFLTLILFMLFPKISYAVELPPRLAGETRYDTSVEVSQAGWYTGAQTVVIASGQNFPDALAGAPLAYKLNAPILLTAKDILPNVIKDEIIRLKASNVIILGGINVVSASVEQTLRGMNLNIERIAGETRFDTAAKIAERVGNNTGKVVIANGFNFPDALGIAPYAARMGYPILLTDTNVLPQPTRAALTNIKETIVVGGSLVVGQKVFNQLPLPKRFSGATRFDTVVDVVRNLHPDSSKVFIATGFGFADAIASSVLAAKDNAPILLVTQNKVPEVIQSLIRERGITDFVISGGPNVVGENVLRELVLGKPLYGKKIVLDPGHGGRDPGAVHNGFQEKDLNWQLTMKISNLLQGLGATVLTTPRPVNNTVSVSLQERGLFANQQKPDLFVSIHHDASTDTSVNGVSTHYSSYRPAVETNDVYVTYKGNRYQFLSESTDPNNKGFYINYNGNQTLVSYYDLGVTAYDPTPCYAAQRSKLLAESMVNDVATTGLANKGARDHNLYVTRWTTMPSVLIEAGFISNVNDAKSAANPVIQEQRAQKVVNSISNFFKE